MTWNRVRFESRLGKSATSEARRTRPEALPPSQHDAEEEDDGELVAKACGCRYWKLNA